MVYAMVKDGHSVKVKGSTVWKKEDDAKAHLAALAKEKPDHWKKWKVKSVDAVWEIDTVPHTEFPDNPAWRSLLRDAAVGGSMKRKSPAMLARQITANTYDFDATGIFDGEYTLHSGALSSHSGDKVMRLVAIDSDGTSYLVKDVVPDECGNYIFPTISYEDPYIGPPTPANITAALRRSKFWEHSLAEKVRKAGADEVIRVVRQDLTFLGLDNSDKASDNLFDKLYCFSEVGIIGTFRCTCNCHDPEARKVMSMKEHENCGQCGIEIAKESATLKDMEEKMLYANKARGLGYRIHE